jgi:hypothetical protein
VLCIGEFPETSRALLEAVFEFVTAAGQRRVSDCASNRIGVGSAAHEPSGKSDRAVRLVGEGLYEGWHEGVQPNARNQRVRLSASRQSVIDGPFAETRKWVSGF